MLIGRDKERQLLQEAMTAEYSQFIAVYGRRRVGKTFLIRESFDYQFAFQFTGADKTPTRRQLARFRNALKQQGQSDTPQLTNWTDAFYELERFLAVQPDGKKVVFLDELPWMDAPRSGFLTELEAFWNGWVSARKDIVLVVCGSATSWMVNKIIKNKGGLHNRLTHRVALKPFSLGRCSELCAANGLVLSPKQILMGYMVFGGIPYYWSLLRKGASMDQEIDRLIFSAEGEMHDEFEMLYAALFRTPQPYLDIIAVLATKQQGLTREEMISRLGIGSSGHLSDILNDLEWCGFIRSYSMMGYQIKSLVYQLIDNYTLFYYAFLVGRKNSDFSWTTMIDTPKYNTWHGLAFERVCLWHVPQIKQKLGISGIQSEEYTWRYAGNPEAEIPGAQIDLLIRRRDDIIDLCEMKYSSDEFAITSDYAAELQRKKSVFTQVTKTRSAIHLVLITTDGVAHNAHWGEIQNEVTLADLMH